MPAKSSPELLANLFARFQRRTKAKTGVNVSMRKVSEELLSQTALTPAKTAGDASRAVTMPKRAPDANALGRWTNPGAKRNWFIPVGRVADVAQQLGATTEERDALMLARLTEIAEHDPKHDVLVCGAWVAERVSEQHRLDADEQAVLEAFRKSRATSPYSMLTSVRLAKLQGAFEEMAKEHLAELALEHAEACLNDLSSEGEARLREKGKRVVEKVRAAQVSVPAAAQVSAQVLARRFLRGLRKA